MDDTQKLQQAQLLESNMGLVVCIAKQFKPKNGNQFDEFVQAGLIGLWKAIKAYDSTRSKFSTTAWNYIRWEILKQIKADSSNHICQDQVNVPVDSETELWEYIPSNLSDLENKVISLHLVDGRSFIEIGKITGFSKTWVHNLYKRAIRKIKDANK